MAEQLRFELQIQAPLSQVSRMFTKAAGLREWLCDRAIVDSKPGGSFYVRWNRGYFAFGTFTFMEPQKVIFTWQGRGDPASSQVEVSLTPNDSGTSLVLVHSGFGEGEEWQKTKSEIQRGWEVGLENLKNVLENGPDLRIVHRPMMGIFFGGNSPEIAAKEGIPYHQGLWIDDTMEGLGARQAGLTKNDVMVRFEGRTVASFDDITPMIERKRAGDVVEVGFYRGDEERTVRMTLAFRPIRDIPMNAQALAAAQSEIYTQDWAAVDEALAGVTEEEASHKPGGKEWNVKEILAHLLHTDRAVQQMILDKLFDNDAPAGFNENSDITVKATADTYGSLPEVVGALKCAQAEVITLMNNLPDSLVERKSSFWSLAYDLLSFPGHGREHAAQIKEAVTAARGQ